MKFVAMVLAMTGMVSAAQAFEIPQMGSTPKEAAILGANHKYAQQNKVRDEETGCQGSILNSKKLDAQTGEAVVLLSDCSGLQEGFGLMYKVTYKLNLTVPGGVYIVEKVIPASAPSEALTAK